MMTPQNLIFASSSLFVLLHFFPTCLAKLCTPSACGVIRNISAPFRLNHDPSHCGDSRFELACENDVASLSLNSHKHFVKQINYNNATIRLVDASININDVCSFPNSSASRYNFTWPYPYPYSIRSDSPPYDDVAWPVNLMSCTKPLKNSSLFVDFTHCNPSHTRFTYIKVGHLNASEVVETCRIDVIVMTSWGFKDPDNVSLEEIHQSLLYGFELRVCEECGPYPYPKWIEPLIALSFIIGLICAVAGPPVITLVGFSAFALLLYHMVALSSTVADEFRYYHQALFIGLIVIELLIIVPRIIIFPFALWFLIYKFRKRHSSMYNAIESFLQGDNKLTPIRYSYSDIKKMTRGFQDKLGEGGYGSVYKGKLRSGHDVAVKLLGKSGANGQDFMNEIATIGRIHHVNVVKLVEYCAQGSKRALVFDFMPNGSLEKYIFDTEKSDYLNWETKFDVAVGVARGIEYLHRGCDVQILHFDIKPHNILLDDKFIPKISDFGLAKFCSTKKNTMTLTAARGTIGYVASELINRGLGRVSYKADVYSFRMLLMEIVRLKRDLTGNKDGSSKYFPCWIYDCFDQGKDIEIAKVDDDSTRKLARKMTIVALWCIRMCPDDRPPMNKVLEMLEGDVERLQLPHYPSQSTQILINEDQIGITCSTDSISLLHHDNNLSCVEIVVQE